MHYMEMQCEEAQAALGRKYEEEAALIRRAEMAEDQVEKAYMALSLSESQLVTANQNQSLLMQKLLSERVQLARQSHIGKHREQTEQRLHAEAGRLIECLDGAVRTQQGLVEELHSRLRSKEVLKQATRGFSEQAQHSLDAFVAESASFFKEQLGRQDVLVALLDEAHARISSSLSSVDSQSGVLVAGLQEGVSAIEQKIKRDLQELSTHQDCYVGAAVSKASEISLASSAEASSTLAVLEELRLQHKSAERELSCWVVQARGRLEAMQGSIQKSLAAHSSALQEDFTRFASECGSHSNLLQTQSAQLTDLLMGVSAHSKLQKETLGQVRDTSSFTAERARDLAALAQSQFSTLRAALQEDHSVRQGLQSRHAETLQAATLAVQKSSAAQLQSMENQLQTIRNAVTEYQMQGVAATDALAHSLVNTKETLFSLISKQLSELTEQQGNLAEILSLKSLLGGITETEQTHAATLAATVQALKQSVEEQTASLAKQRSLLQSAVHEDLEGSAAASYATHQSSLEVQRSCVETAMREHAAQATRVVESVMEGMQMLMQTKMAELGSAFSDHMNQLLNHNSELKGQTQAWGATDRQAAAKLHSLLDANAALTSTVDQGFRGFDTHMQSLCQHTAAWGQADRNATDRIHQAVDSASSAVKENVMMTQQVAQAYDTMSKQTAAAVASSHTVYNQLKGAWQANEELQVAETTSCASHSALFCGASCEAVELTNSCDRIAQSMVRASADNTALAAFGAATAAETVERLDSASKQLQLSIATSAETLTAAINISIDSNSTHLESVQQALKAGQSRLNDRQGGIESLIHNAVSLVAQEQNAATALDTDRVPIACAYENAIVSLENAVRDNMSHVIGSLQVQTAALASGATHTGESLRALENHTLDAHGSILAAATTVRANIEVNKTEELYRLGAASTQFHQGVKEVGAALQDQSLTTQRVISAVAERITRFCVDDGLIKEAPEQAQIPAPLDFSRDLSRSLSEHALTQEGRVAFEETAQAQMAQTRAMLQGEKDITVDELLDSNTCVWNAGVENVVKVESAVNIVTKVGSPERKRRALGDVSSNSATADTKTLKVQKVSGLKLPSHSLKKV